jgi:hypothetical protein
LVGCIATAHRFRSVFEDGSGVGVARPGGPVAVQVGLEAARQAELVVGLGGGSGLCDRVARKGNKLLYGLVQQSDATFVCCTELGAISICEH